jgi:hypothetical protein
VVLTAGTFETRDRLCQRHAGQVDEIVQHHAAARGGQNRHARRARSAIGRRG